MNPSFEQTLIEVWRQTLVENAKVIELGKGRYPVHKTPKRGLRQVDFVFDGNEIRGLEQSKGCSQPIEWGTKCKNCPPGRKRLKYRGLLFHDQRRSAARNLIRDGVPETVAMKITGHKTRAVFDRYIITSERDLADAARKIESSQLSYRRAKVAENAEETQQSGTCYNSVS